MRTRAELESYKSRVDTLEGYLVDYIAVEQRNYIETEIDKKLDGLLEIPSELKIDITLIKVIIPDWQTWKQDINISSNVGNFRDYFPSLHDMIWKLPSHERLLLPFVWYKELVKGLEEYNFKEDIETELHQLIDTYEYNDIKVKPTLLIKGKLWEVGTSEK